MPEEFIGWRGFCMSTEWSLFSDLICLLVLQKSSCCQDSLLALDSGSFISAWGFPSSASKDSWVLGQCPGWEW